MSTLLIHVAIVAAGGALGAAGRHLTNVAAMRIFGGGFPWGTMTVNIVGSLAMGLAIGWLARRSDGDVTLGLFMTTGILGGFTTFSAFSLDALSLWQRGDVLLAFAYVAGSVLLSLLAVFAGLSFMRAGGL